jgi:hypothetical protein
MKKHKCILFLVMPCALAFLSVTRWSVAAAPYHKAHFVQGPNLNVDMDLEKLQVPRAARDLDSLANLIDVDSKKWKSTDSASYLAYMYGACGEISSYDYPDRAKQAKLLTRYSLEVLDSEHLSLEQRFRFLEFMGYDAPDWDEVTWRHLRFQKANLWLDTWKQFAVSVDPTFDGTEVPMINIDPPAGTSVPSGSSPEAVKDPKLRAEYEHSLAANLARTARINERQYLRMNAGQFYAEAEKYLVNAYSKAPTDSAELDHLLTRKRIDPATHARLLMKIRDHNWGFFPGHPANLSVRGFSF